jgi:GNAT superfamily N-acetyltransferase
VKLETFQADPTGTVLATIRPLYAEIYAEDPYGEGPADVDDFAETWPSRASQPGFRAVIAYTDTGTPIGFTFGHQLSPTTQWWNGLQHKPDPQPTTEWPGRTFAIIEMAVKATHRRAGIGEHLHTALLTDRTEQRATLLCRPEAKPAYAAYTNWGYQPIGNLQPFPHAPTYIAMLRPLPL